MKAYPRIILTRGMFYRNMDSTKKYTELVLHNICIEWTSAAILFVIRLGEGFVLYEGFSDLNTKIDQLHADITFFSHNLTKYLSLNILQRKKSIYQYLTHYGLTDIRIIL